MFRFSHKYPLNSLRRLSTHTATFFTNPFRKSTSGKDKTYDVFKELGVHRPPPAVGIWISNTYKLGIAKDVLLFIRALGFPIFSEQKVENEIHKFFSDNSIGVLDIISRSKEGGCFVYFNDMSNAKSALELIRQKRKLVGRKVEAYIVKGEPYLEDLVLKKPSPKLVVELDGQITEEQLFSMFRWYGRIATLNYGKLKSEIIFLKKRSAISARNCLRNMTTKSDAKLVIEYVPYTRLHKLFEALKSPKLIPIVAILITICLYLLIEPFRLMNVTQTLALNWREMGMKLPSGRMEAHEKELAELQELLTKKPGPIIMVIGPQGSGKTTLIRRILRNRHFAVRVDCAKGDFTLKNHENNFIEQLEQAVGFKPGFNALNSLVGYIEMVLPTKKTAISTTKMSQLTKILSTLDQGLKIISATNPKFPPLIVFDGFPELIQAIIDDSGGDKAKAKVLLDCLLKWAANTSQVERTAHVLFVSGNSTAVDIFPKKGGLRNRLKVIEINDVSKEEAIKYICQQIGEGVTQESNRGSAVQTDKPAPELESKWSFLKYLQLMRLWKRQQKNEIVESHKTHDISQLTDERVKSVKDAVEIIGGRLGDIDSLVKRVIDGKPIEQAVRDMIEEGKRDIITNGFGEKFFVDSLPGIDWNHVQLWNTMKLLVDKQQVPYSELLCSDIFDGDKKALDSLIDKHILGVTNIESADNQDRYVVAHSPLALTAFKEIVNDPKFIKKMEKVVIEFMYAKHQKRIDRIEQELFTLRKSVEGGTGGTAVQERIKVLNQMLEELNKKYAYEREKEKNLAKIVVK